MRVKRMTLVEGMSVKIDFYPNFHKNGNVRSMKENVYGNDALLVRCGNYIYKVPKEIYDSVH